MKIDWTSILNLLESSPADLVYHLVIGSAVLLIFTGALRRRGQNSRSQAQNHLLIGASVLISLRILLFIFDQLLMLSLIHI